MAKRRRYILDPETKFRKLRNVSDEDIVRLLGHRKPGEDYKSLHPPLDELKIVDDPIRELVEPSDGARAGDKIRFAQFTDSLFHSPLVPWFRARLYHTRYRGVDTITYSGRELLEMRERDLEKHMKELLETELFDPARSALRGITVHGSSLRLDENGLMFDARRRYIYENGNVVYVKDQNVVPLDKPISLGPPVKEEELEKNSIIYGSKTVDYDDADEIYEITGRIMKLSVVCGLDPERAGKNEERGSKTP